MKAFNEWLKNDFICSYWSDCIVEDKIGEKFFKNNPLKEHKSKFLIDITYNPKYKKATYILMHTMGSTDEMWRVERLFAHYDDEQKHAEQYCDAMQEKFEMEKCVGHGNRNARGGL